MPVDWNEEGKLLVASGVDLAPGLSEDELVAVESVHAFRFPVDLRSLLAEFLPIGRGFPDWRKPTSEEILESLSWPFEGIEFDIKNNEFWWDKWGKKPTVESEALAIAKVEMGAAATLIPIYAHRYIAARPVDPGNPVFSVYQTDIIYYGSDLSAYLRCEFGDLQWDEAVSGEPRAIEFWTELVEDGG